MLRLKVLELGWQDQGLVLQVGHVCLHLIHIKQYLVDSVLAEQVVLLLEVGLLLDRGLCRPELLGHLVDVALNDELRALELGFQHLDALLDLLRLLSHLLRQLFVDHVDVGGGFLLLRLEALDDFDDSVEVASDNLLPDPDVAVRPVDVAQLVVVLVLPCEAHVVLGILLVQQVGQVLVVVLLAVHDAHQGLLQEVEVKVRIQTLL